MDEQELIADFTAATADLLRWLDGPRDLVTNPHYPDYIYPNTNAFTALRTAVLNANKLGYNTNQEIIHGRT